MKLEGLAAGTGRTAAMENAGKGGGRGAKADANRVGARSAVGSTGAKKRTATPRKRAGVANARKASVRPAKAQAEVVQKLLKKVEQKLSGDDVKASLGDYIRLVQLHKELDEETPREIKVTWVEPKGTESKKTEGETESPMGSENDG